jgi:hypothetical protein
VLARRRIGLVLGLVTAVALGGAACRKEKPRPAGKTAAKKTPPKPKPRPPMPWDSGGGVLAEGETFALNGDGSGGKREKIEAARAAGMLDVDLGDGWAPFIFSESDPGGEVKPNPYRETFVTLANNRATPDELFLESPEGRRSVLLAAEIEPARKGQPPSDEEKQALETARRTLRGERSRNYLEVYGIPPTLSVLRRRLAEDRGKPCFGEVDLAALAAFTGEVPYINRERARREYNEAVNDAAWAEKVRQGGGGDAGAAPPAAAMLPTSTLPRGSAAGLPAAATQPPAAGFVGPPTLSPEEQKIATRLERTRRGQVRLAAIRATQARLICEGLLSEKSKFIDGMFDLPTHEALALWEKKNDIFGWGFLAGETREALQRPPMELHFETFKRVVMERVADAAGIIEDGSVSKGRRPATYKDQAGKVHKVPDLIGQYSSALLKAMRVETPEEMDAFLGRMEGEALGRLHVAWKAPPLPPYYGPEMALSVDVDRGDVWYDFPWDDKGKPVVQKREKYPSVALFVEWNKQRILLGRWRTTIGSWRSELGEDGKVYYKYKNSDVGPRIWKNIVAAPVWIPPDATPAKDMLTKKVFDRNVGPVDVVNTDVMGPGFQSAYGLAMAIHLKVMPGGGVFDNMIRTHGSVDYTSIARRFSHGCHRMVNNRAVRLFNFALKHRAFKRTGDIRLGNLRKTFTVDDKEYAYTLTTRGYYYELTPPIPVNVNEGRIMGAVKKPITAYIRKPGVDYGDAEDAEGEANGIETQPTVGP